MLTSTFGLVLACRVRRRDLRRRVQPVQLRPTPHHRDCQPASRHVALREQRQRLREQLIQSGVLGAESARFIRLRRDSAATSSQTVRFETCGIFFMARSKLTPFASAYSLALSAVNFSAIAGSSRRPADTAWHRVVAPRGARFPPSAVGPAWTGGVQRRVCDLGRALRRFPVRSFTSLTCPPRNKSVELKRTPLTCQGERCHLVAFWPVKSSHRLDRHIDVSGLDLERVDAAPLLLAAMRWCQTRRTDRRRRPCDCGWLAACTRRASGPSGRFQISWGCRSPRGSRLYGRPSSGLAALLDGVPARLVSPVVVPSADHDVPLVPDDERAPDEAAGVEPAAATGRPRLLIQT